MKSARTLENNKTEITATRQFYQGLYQSLYQDIIQLESGCVGIAMDEVVQQLMGDEDDKPTLRHMIANISTRDWKRGVLFHDMSGVGLYILAYVIAKLWADNKALDQFEAVIVVPLEWMHLADNLTNIWGEDAAKVPKADPRKTLVILSGCSTPSWRENDKTKSRSAINRCLETIKMQGYSTLVVSNASQVPYLENQPKIVKQISLRPLNLFVQYECGEQRTEFVIPGKVVLETATAAIELNYLHRDISDNHIAYTPDWAQQMFNTLLNKDQQVKRDIIKPEHTYPSLKPYKVVKLVLNHLDMHDHENHHNNNAQPDEMVMFTSPANWYSAAVTATAKSADSDVACYRISNFLMVRKLSNNYIACIDLADSTPKLPVKLRHNYDASELTQLRACLNELAVQADFQQLSTDELIDRLDRISSGKRKQVRGKFNVSSEDTLKQIKDGVRSENPEKKKFNSLFAAGATDLAYHAIQERVTETLKDDKNPTQLIRQILSGANVQVDKNIVLGLAATLLSETCRYRVNFMTTLCLLDLIEVSNDEARMWQMFFAHPMHIYNPDQTSIRQLILSDIVHTIGGLQAMSHGNSYNQVKPDSQKPQFGMHWVDFKSHLILGQWVSRMLVNEKELNPYFSSFMRSDKVTARVITEMLLGFTTIPFANPQMYDRFSRRLNSFGLMLIEQIPLRNRLSGDISTSLAYLTEFKCQPFYRMMLTDARDGSDYQKNRFAYTMASRLFFGITLKEADDGQQLGIITSANDNIHETSVPIKYYNAGLLNSVLMIDPLFYAVHYHMAVYYLERMSDTPAALAAIDRYLQSAKMNDGDMFFCAIFIKLRCLFNLNHKDLFMSLANFYFKHYHDLDDDDYWYTHLMWASLSENYHEQVYEMEMYFNNIPFRDHASYLSPLSTWLTVFPELHQRNFNSQEDFLTEVKKTAQALETQNCRLYLHRNGFFSPSRYASMRQPYGPFRDYFCKDSNAAVELTDKLTKRVNQ